MVTEPIEDLVVRLRHRLETDKTQNLYIHRDTLKRLLAKAAGEPDVVATPERTN